MTIADLATWLLDPDDGPIAVDEARADAILSPPPGHFDKSPLAEALREMATQALAECDAKRQIVERWRELADEVAAAEDRDDPDAAPVATEFAYEQVCLALAQPYAGRPGWRDEWRTP